MANYDKTWNSGAQHDADSRFVAKRDLEGFAINLESLNWSIVENRQQAFDMIKDFGNNFAKYVVAHDTQFPAYSTLIMYSSCNLPKQMAQLEEATSYKESSKHRDEPKSHGDNKPGVNRIGKSNMHAVENHTGGTIITFDSDDDARLAYYEAIRSLKLITQTKSCLITRKSFEDDHQLKWE